MKIWHCKIGEIPGELLPEGADLPMRRAIEAGYRELTGRDPDFTFSGWGAELTEAERAVVEDRLPMHKSTNSVLMQIDPAESEALEIRIIPEEHRVVVLRHGMGEPEGGREVHSEMIDLGDD